MRFKPSNRKIYLINCMLVESNAVFWREAEINCKKSQDLTFNRQKTKSKRRAGRVFSFDEKEIQSKMKV